MQERLTRHQAEHVALYEELAEFVNVDMPPGWEPAEESGPWSYLGLLAEALSEWAERNAAETAGQDGPPF